MKKRIDLWMFSIHNEEMNWETAGFLAILLLAVFYGFSNGYRDSSTIVATIVSTRAVSPRGAFFLCAVSEFFGALLIGTAVISNIGGGFFKDSASLARSDLLSVMAVAFLSALMWGIVGWLRAWPISNTQSLFAGFMGASLSAWDPDMLNGKIVLILFAVLVSSPLIGFFLSTILTALIRWAGHWLTPRVLSIVQRLQVLFSMIVGAVHGSNDGQVIMAFVVLSGGTALGASASSGPGVALWIRLMIAFAIGFGVAMGGKRLLKRMGMQFYRIKPSQGLGAETAAAITIFSCLQAGFPTSAMQVLTGGIVGAGVAKNPKAIRWEIAGDIVLSWLITIPAVGLTGYAVHSGFKIMVKAFLS